MKNSSCSQRQTKRRQRLIGKQMAESVCFLVLGHLPCSFGLLKGCYTLACQDSPCCWEMLPAAGCMMALQSHAFPTVGFSPSKQFQTPSDIVHHLLLTHDGQDSAGPSLYLPKTKGVGYVLRLPYISMPCTQKQQKWPVSLTWVSPASCTR